MAAYKTGALVHLKYYTPFQKISLKWITRSKQEFQNDNPVRLHVSHIGIIGESPGQGGGGV